jgi:hypothetical protein
MKDHQPLVHLSLIIMTPPFFDYNDYVYWKYMIIIYLQSIDYDLWLSIENRPHKPTKIKNDITVPKPRSKYSDGDRKLLSMDAKAMNTLYYAFSRSESNRVISCRNARDIWNALAITHERMNQVKE